MTGTAVQSRFLTLDQVAEDLQLSRRTIERLVAADILPSVRVGGSRRVAVAELDEWIGERRTAEAAGPSLPSGPQQTPAALVRDPDPAGSRSRTEREGAE